MTTCGQIFQQFVEEVFDIFDAIAAMSVAEWLIPVALGVLSASVYLKFINKGSAS